ncbi:MAG TPA: PAS domain-containing protein [Kofleriaceae bacterium]|nr:PAS domain-containing protein [Kofleriaceae bacterium]
MAAASSPGELLESLHEEVVWEADAVTEELLFVSAAAEHLFGYPMSEWRTDRARFWAAHVHADDRERCRAAGVEATRAGRDHELEYRMMRADGTIVWVRDRVYLVRDEGGAVVALRGIMTDITGRHRAESAMRDSEDRLRLALEAGQLGTWDFTPASGVMLCSARCYELLSVAPGTGMTYESFIARIHPEDRARVRACSETILAGGGAELCEIEYRLDLADGGERWLSTLGRIHRDRSGRPTRIVGTMADITERVRSQRALEELLAQLTAEKLRAERASRAKDEFLAMLGHELRNPLAPIRTALEVMALRQAGEPSREETVIRRQVDHLVRLVDDLLDVSRLTGGQFVLDRRPLDVADVVGDAVELTSPLFEQRRHHLSVDVPRGALQVSGDERRLVQVVAHLLDNAARYTEPGGRVAVRASRAGDRAVIEVADSGAGVAPELLPHVFDLFVQAGRAPDRSEGGLGIGLSLVRTFVRMHGGEVAAKNGAAGGSIFEIALPLLPDDAAADWPRGRAESPSGPGRRDRQSAILVVDDNQDAADLLAEVLRDQGHQVLVAHDGPQALERVGEFRPEVAILDIGLPVMDGYELALALRTRLGPELRLLAVTGYGQERDRARSHEVGFEKHFVKPVALTDLLDAIEVD